jgi:polysaccharide biosynthesis protein PslJ
MTLRTQLIGPRIGRALLVVIAAAMVLGAAYMLPRYVTDFGFIVVPLVIVGFLAILALFVIPVDVLPALALTLYVLIPPRVLPQDGPLGALPVTSIVLVVWGFRRLILGEGNAHGSDQDREPAPFKLAALLFGLAFLVWAALSLLRTPDVQTSLGWLISFTAGALLPLAIGNATKEAARIRDMWLLLGGWLGAYAVVEAVVRINPLWGTLYDALGLPDAQHWAVYRASASFGHPLFAALFFAVACTLAIGNWLTSRSKGAMAAAVFSGLGLVATISRGALLGAAIAVAFAYIAALLIRGEKRWGRFGFIGVVAVIAVVGLFQFDAFAARSDSREGQLSSGARDTALWVTFRAADLTAWLGSGAGTSGITGRLFADVVIESALLQLIIGLGLPGLILFSLILASALLHALSRGAVGPAAALLTYAICISTFNALDAVRPMHLLLGCLLILTLNPPGDDSPLEPDTTPVARKVSRADAAH